jgi:hypothetical protein
MDVTKDQLAELLLQMLETETKVHLAGRRVAADNFLARIFRR